MSFAALSSHAAAEEHALSLPPGTLAAIIADLLALVQKYVPVLLGGANPTQVATFHADLRALEAARALPSGAILGILQKLLPVILQLLPVLTGGAAAAP